MKNVVLDKMSKAIYEGTIGGYSFVMTESTTIEVWDDFGSEYPEAYIYVKPGSIKNEKDFHIEISDWYMKSGK